MALRSFNWLIKYDNYSDGINHIAKIIKTVGGKTGLFFAGHKGNRGAVRTSAIPIWAGKEFEPTKVRLISGDAALFLGLEVIEIFRLSVDLDTRRLQFGQGEWKAMVGNGENRWVFRLARTERGYKTSDGYFTKMGIAKLKYYPFCMIAKSAATFGMFRIRNKVGEARKLATRGDSAASLKEMCNNCLSKAISTFSGNSIKE